MAQPTRFPSGVSVANKKGAVAEAPIKQFSIPISFADGINEVTTAFTFPASAVIMPYILLNVRTAEVTGTTTIDIGTNTDPNGLAVGLDVSATGLVKTTLAATATLGALLTTTAVAGDIAEIDITSGEESISWTPGTNDWTTLQADIIIEYREVKII